MLSDQETEGLRRLELQQRAFGRSPALARSVAPAIPATAAATPQGVVQTLGLQVNVLFKESLKQVPEDVLRKMYDEFMSEVRRRGMKL